MKLHEVHMQHLNHPPIHANGCSFLFHLRRCKADLCSVLQFSVASGTHRPPSYQAHDTTGQHIPNTMGTDASFVGIEIGRAHNTGLAAFFCWARIISALLGNDKGVQIIWKTLR